MFEDGSETVVCQWRVVYFPAGAKDQQRTFTNEKAARDFYESRAELGDAPILESRWVKTTDWKSEPHPSGQGIEGLKAALERMRPQA